VSRLAEIARRIQQDLDESGVSFALVGALAVSVRAEPRFTRDIDLALAVTDDRQAESVIFTLGHRGYRTVASVELEAVGRLATVRLSPPGELLSGVVVDLLFASSGIEPEVVSSAESLELMPGLTLPVSRTGHLIALKVLSRDDRRRPQDLADLRSLLRVASPEEMDRAKASLRLIADRGYNRDRDLIAGLADLLKVPPLEDSP